MRSQREICNLVGKARMFPICILSFFPCSLGMKQRSNVISYVTVNDSPDSDSSLSSPYASDPLSSLRSTGGALELPSRAAADSSSSRTIIVPPLKTQLNDCIVATQASGRYLRVLRGFAKAQVLSCP